MDFFKYPIIKYLTISIIVFSFNLCITFGAMAFAGENAIDVDNTGELRFHLGVEAEILQGQDIKDVQSATNIWLTWVGENWKVKGKSTIYKDLPSITKDFIQGKIDLISLTGLNYLKFIRQTGKKLELGPTGTFNGKLQIRYLLIVSRKLKDLSISGLRGKKLSLKMVSGIERLFINTLLLRAGMVEADHFFSAITEKTKPSRSVLDVFFGKSDACIVPEYVFITMVELNPQIGRQMRILAVSPAVLPTVTGFRKDCDPWVKKFILDKVPILQKDEKGKQILLMYKIEGIANIQDTDLDTLRAMVLEYETLKAKHKTNEN
jgi:phosphonate transport system substrate-binding protein